MVQENLMKYLPPPKYWPTFYFGAPNLEPPEELNIGEDLFSRVIKNNRENSIAVIDNNKLVTFSELIKRSNQVANYLNEVIGTKEVAERVIVRLHNSSEYIESLLGIFKSGRVAIVTFFGLRAEELKYIIDKTEARIAICGKQFLDEFLNAMENTTIEHLIVVGNASDLPDTIKNVKIHSYDRIAEIESKVLREKTLCQWDDIACVMYTSGVTGRPKGCIMTHGSLYALNRFFDGMPFRPLQEDRVMAPIPWSFAWGYCFSMAVPLFNGSTLIVMPLGARDPDRIAEMIDRYKVTVFNSVPTFYYRMLQADVDKKYNLSSLRVLTSAGAPLNYDLWDEIEKRFGTRLYNCYGTTETHGIFWSWSNVNKKKMLPIPSIRYMIVSEDGKPLKPGKMGRIATIGIGGALYWGETEKQKEAILDGWTIMADNFIEDEDGSVIILGRADDMIKVSGALVSPDEVEQVILGHPIVNEVVVVGKPDPERGQIVKAFIVPKRELSVDEKDKIKEEITSMVKSKLPSYKVPREIDFIKSIPTTSSGKVVRRKLLEKEISKVGNE